MIKIVGPGFSRSRRSALIALAGSAALFADSKRALAAIRPAAGVFQHGVASGDPDSRSVVLWTRASLAAPGPVAWEVATTPDFDHVVQRGEAQAGPESDYTVKVVADRLSAAGSWYYRFRAAGEISPVGRARTLPDGPIDSLGIAVVSCSNYAFGYFNAYDAIASDSEVDFVLHTGDYIYEYGASEWGGNIARQLGRVHEPPNEIVSLADYRRRHAQYKSDPDAQAMHAAHSLLACWDDHESANNPWTGGAQNHQPASEGEWNARREASIRAYFEWMPIREPGPDRTRKQFWRSYAFGDLATLFTLETRHTARAEQVDYATWEGRISSLAEARALERETIEAPERAMLAGALETDLQAALKRSVAGGQPWRLIGNPMPIARTRVPDVVGQGLMPDPFLDAGSPAAAKLLAWKGKWNLPFYPDTWDGYAWARERLYRLCREAGASDLVYLTGDSHSFWANRLADAGGRPVGVELGTAGVTSPGDFVDSGFGRDLASQLDRAFEAHNPEVVWTDNLHQGYVRLNLTRSLGLATFVALDTVTTTAYRTRVLRRFSITQNAGALTLKHLSA